MISRRRDLEIDLGYLRDNIVQAIDRGNSGLVKDGLETYEELVVTFMDVVSRFTDPAISSQTLATDARSWEELRWISDAYVEMIEAAFHGARRGILNDVMEFPLGVAYRAWDARDPAVFGIAMGWARLAYLLSTEEATVESAPRVHANVAQHVGLRLHELLSYSVLPTLERAADELEIASIAVFIEDALVTYNALLKRAYDQRQDGDFSVFAKDLYDVFQPGYRRYEFTYRWPFDDTPLNATQSAIVNLARFLEVMSIGLDAWILRDLLAEKIDVPAARRYRGQLMIPSEAHEVWNLYVRTTHREYDRRFEWSWWEVAEHESRRAFVGADFSWLVLRDVLLRLMELTKDLNQDAVNTIPLDLPDNLDYALGERGPVNTQLAELEASERVRALVDFDVHAAAEKLRPLFATLKTQAENERIEHIKRSPVSTERVDLLRDDIVKGWKESSNLRAVFRAFGPYRYHSTDEDVGSPLAIHKLDLKEMYIEPSRFSIDRVGVEYGRAMTVGEDRFAAEKLTSQLKRFSQDPLDSLEVIRAVTEALDGVDAPDAVIIMVGVNPALWALRRSEEFEWGSAVPSDSLPQPNGLFKGHAVYQVHEANSAFIVVADLRRTGVWHQYRPDIPKGAQLLEDTLLFELEAFDEASAEALLVDAPDTYAFDNQRPDRRTHEEQLDLVLRSVRLRILEKLSYEVREPDAGRVIEVKSDVERL